MASDEDEYVEFVPELNRQIDLRKCSDVLTAVRRVLGVPEGASVIAYARDLKNDRAKATSP